MRIKKILSAVLAAVITASSLSIVSSAKAPETPQTVEETVEKNYLASGDTAYDDNFKYTELSDGTWSVTCPNKDTVKAVIPATFKGKKVTKISNGAFRNCTNLTSVTIPSSVTSIGDNAFYGCTSLKSLKIPSGVKSLGIGAFQSCKSLTSITIPNGVTSIGNDTFEGCANLTSVTMPTGVTSIGTYAFSRCKSLTSITIPKGVKSIGWNAFYNCTSLTSVTIPNSVTRIDNSVFENCTSLTSVTIPTSITSIDNYAFSGCKSLKSVKIPNGVTKIGSYAFYECTNLTLVMIPTSVKTIDMRAFYDCPNIKDVYYTGPKAQWNSISIYLDNSCLTNNSVQIHYGHNPNISGLKATPTNSSVKLTWEKSPYASYYKVFVWKDGKWTQLIKTANNTTLAYTASNLTSATSYKYRVTAYNGDNIAISYSDITAKTKYPAVANLKAAPTTNTAKLTWSKYASASYYKVFIWKNNAWTQLTKTTSNATVAYTASNLAANTSYKFRVTAYNSSNTAIAYSDITSKTYGKIASLSATPAVNTVKLTWGKNTTASYYKVFIWKNSKWTQLTKTANNTTLAYTAGSLTPNTSYKFRVTGYNSSDKAIAYSDITVKTKYGTIANLKAAPTNSSVKLTWSKNTSASYYKVFVWESGTWMQLTQTGSNATVTYTESGLVGNTSYKFRVTAYNSSGKAIAYSDVTAKTTYGTIANLKSTSTSSSAKLTWSKNTSAGYYKVFIWKNSKWTELTKTGSNATVAYTASKLSASTFYKFRVTAYTSSGKAIAYSDITVKTTA